MRVGHNSPTRGAKMEKMVNMANKSNLSDPIDA